VHAISKALVGKQKLGGPSRTRKAGAKERIPKHTYNPGRKKGRKGNGETQLDAKEAKCKAPQTKAPKGTYT